MENDTKNSSQISKTLLLINSLLVVLVIGMVILVSNSLQNHEVALQASLIQSQEPLHNMFDTLSLQGKAIYVYDVAEKKVIFQKNAQIQLPLASLTKLMMALVATNLAPPDTHITIKKSYLSADGDNGLVVGETWSMKDLLDFSLVVSSNDGARSLASAIGSTIFHTDDIDIGRKNFISKMNEEAQTLGLTQTYFINENGLDVGNLSGGYGSAENISKLLDYMITKKPQILEATKKSSTKFASATNNHTAKNTDTIVTDIPGLIASKTGYTDLAGGNLAIAFDAGVQRPLIIVVLGSTEAGRFTDMSQLVKASIAYIKE